MLCLITCFTSLSLVVAVKSTNEDQGQQKQTIPVLCEEAYPSCRQDPNGAYIDHAQHICLKRHANVLPPKLLKELDETPASGSTHWFAKGAALETVHQEVALTIAERIGITPADYETVEYWSKSGLDHAGQYDNEFQKTMHYDTQQEWDCLGLPWMTTILYHDNRGPPTVLVGKTFSDSPFLDVKSGPSNDTTYLSWPARNHVLQASGDVFHGTLAWEDDEHLPANIRGITVFNWWRHKLPAGDSNRRALRNRVSLAGLQPAVELLPKSFEQKLDEERQVLANNYFGMKIDFVLAVKIKIVCQLDKKTWNRYCPDREESSDDMAVFVRLPRSLKKVRILRQPKGFSVGSVWRQRSARIDKNEL